MQGGGGTIPRGFAGGFVGVVDVSAVGVLEFYPVGGEGGFAILSSRRVIVVEIVIVIGVVGVVVVVVVVVG